MGERVCTSLPVRFSIEPTGCSRPAPRRIWQVITLNPSFHKTAIATNATGFLVKSYESLPAEEKALVGDDYFQKCVDVCDRFTKGWCVHIMLSRASERGVLFSLRARRARLGYSVGFDRSMRLAIPPWWN